MQEGPGRPILRTRRDQPSCNLLIRLGRSYARGGGDSGRWARRIAAGAAIRTAPPGRKALTVTVGAGSTPKPPVRAKIAASEPPKALRILHVVSCFPLWCMGQVCPGAIGQSHSCSSCAVALHRMTGAAAAPTSWQTSQPQALHSKWRRTTCIGLWYVITVTRSRISIHWRALVRNHDQSRFLSS